MEIVKELFDVFSRISAENKIKIAEHSAVDSELSKCYHKIEMMKLDHVSKSHNAIKELQDVLRRRRRIKHEASTLQIMHANLAPSMQKLSESLKASKTKQEKLLSDLEKNSY
jgi:hypothetical protein